MKEFAVLDEGLNPLKSYFLEASAGTGKTFAIEHLVRRMVQAGVTIDRILVVTFTKAATRELRARIRQNFERAQDMRLDEALLAFEEARIYTIHGFCFEMLRELAFEGGMCLELSRGQEGLSSQEQLTIVRDFFSMRTDLIGPGQLDRLLGSAAGDFERLARRLLHVKPAHGSTDSVLRARFTEAIEALELQATACREEFERLAPHFIGFCNRQGEIKTEHRARNDRFVAMVESRSWDFDWAVREGIPLVDLGRSRLKRGARPGSLELCRQITDVLGPILDPARDIAALEGLAAVGVRELLAKRMAQRECLTHDGLLEQMLLACRTEGFCRAVRNQFDAVVVDEFQDTDPIQWEVFRRLFVDHLPTILVGDPKQSIYAFRHADIYSYLAAKEALGPECRYSLATNYRARPQLVARLNSLFCSAPGLIALPRLETTLPCESVHAGVEGVGPLADGEPLQFVQAKTEHGLFAFIAREIAALGLPPSAHAVLVTDRYQAQRLQKFLAGCGIPSKTVRGMAFNESPALSRLREAIQAILDPDQAAPALLSLFGVAGDEASLKSREHLAYLKKVLLTKGFPAFVEGLLSFWRPPDDQLHAAYQIGEMLADCPPSRLISALSELELKKPLAGESGPMRPLADDDAVTIQTIFGSKGLEYDVVFALALGWRTRSGDRDPAETDAEKGRLLYVALTRAKERVYVPILSDAKQTDPKPGTASPVELLLEQTSISGFCVRQTNDEKSVPHMVATPPVIHLPQACPVKIPERTLESFSSLCNPHVTRKQAVASEGELAVGAETGIVVHELLEKISLEASREQVEEFCADSQVAELVWRGLTVEIDGFCMAELDPRVVLRETEFLYPVTESGQISGVIDVILFHKDRYYLIDWKTNWLPEYTQASVRASIQESDYALQAELYTEALKRYLKITDLRPFTECFGGAYYIYLRGPIVCRL